MKKYIEVDKLLELLPESHKLNYKYDEGYNACLKKIKEIIQVTDTIILGGDMVDEIVRFICASHSQPDEFYDYHYDCLNCSHWDNMTGGCRAKENIRKIITKGVAELEMASVTQDITYKKDYTIPNVTLEVEEDDLDDNFNINNLIGEGFNI